MSFNDKLPKEIYKIIDKTVIALEKKCEPCEVVIHRVISDRRMMSEEQLAHHATVALKKLAKYIYHRGIVDAQNLTNADRERILRDARETVTYFECRIITPDGPVD
jgi:hypothetical protein